MQRAELSTQASEAPPLGRLEKMSKKVVFKTLQAATFTLDCEGADTVAAVKQKASAQQGPAFPAEFMVFVHKGTVLADTSTIDEAGITDSGFVVCMIKKPAAGEPRSVRRPAVVLADVLLKPKTTPVGRTNA